MAEYISREFMLKSLEADMMNNAEHCEPVTVQIMERFIRYVKEFPTADVQPVNHGRWIHIRGCWWQCSNCENNLIYTMSDRGRTEKHRYCSKCGARMDGESK